MSSAGGNHSQKTKEINDNKVDSDEELAIRNIAQPDEITNNTNVSKQVIERVGEETLNKTVEQEKNEMKELEEFAIRSIAQPGEITNDINISGLKKQVIKRLGEETFDIAVNDEIEKIKKMQENFAFEKSKIVGWIEKWFPNHDPNETLYPDHAKYLIDPDFYDLVKNLSGKSTLEIFTILNSPTALSTQSTEKVKKTRLIVKIIKELIKNQNENAWKFTKVQKKLGWYKQFRKKSNSIGRKLVQIFPYSRNSSSNAQDDESEEEKTDNTKNTDENNSNEKFVKLQDRFLTPMEVYTKEDIFPLPQYLDLTTHRHLQTRYTRLCILVSIWLFMFLLGYLHIQFSTELYRYKVPYDQALHIKTEGCSINFAEETQDALTLELEENFWYWYNMVNPRSENNDNENGSYIDRCSKNTTLPCFKILVNHGSNLLNSYSRRSTGKGKSANAYAKYDRSNGILTAFSPKQMNFPCQIRFMINTKDLIPAFKGLTIVSTGDTKITKKTFTAISKRQVNEFLLKTDFLHINGSTMDINLRNIQTSSLRVFVERGQVQILGSNLGWTGFYDQRAKPLEHVVRIGKPLGKIADVGQWIEDKLSPSNSCGLTPCGGSIKVSVLNSMVVDFEEPDGGVCITAPVIDSLNTKTCSNMTNDQIVYQNTSNTSHAICGTKGETLICTRQDTNCIVNNETTRIKLQTFDGSIFISLPEYNQTETKYFNIRRTIDGQDCIFPFTYNGQKYHECTSVHFKQPCKSMSLYHKTYY